MICYVLVCADHCDSPKEEQSNDLLPWGNAEYYGQGKNYVTC